VQNNKLRLVIIKKEDRNVKVQGMPQMQRGY